MMDNNRYMLCNVEFVAVDNDTYEDLIGKEWQLDAVMGTLFRHASLSWDKKSLVFDDKSLCHVLEAIFPLEYAHALRRLQKQEDETNGTDKSRE